MNIRTKPQKDTQTILERYKGAPLFHSIVKSMIKVHFSQDTVYKLVPSSCLVKTSPEKTIKKAICIIKRIDADMAKLFEWAMFFVSKEEHKLPAFERIVDVYTKKNIIGPL